MKLPSPLFWLYLLFLLLLTLFTLEVGSRIKHQGNYLATNIQLDRVFHHLLPPYTEGKMSSEGDFNATFTTNNRGMRGPGDYYFFKKPAVYRIAIMGDSFTFGVGVKAKETYSHLLEKKLNRSGKNAYQVYNFGVSSFSPVLEFLYLKKRVQHYRPDLLVLALDLCDIQDDYFYESHLLFNKGGRAIACDPYKTNGSWDVWAFLKRHSIFCAILDEKLVQSYHKMEMIGFKRYFWNKSHHVRNKTEILMNPDLDNIQFDRFLFTREDKNPKIVDRHWARTASYLKKIKDFCDANSIRFVLTAYPYGHQVGTNQWSKGRHYWAFEDNKVYDASKPFGRIQKFANRYNIEFISLLEPLQAHAAQTLYYHNDGHWTPQGHRVVADALYEALSEKI